jgi:uridylate kinase
MTKPETDVLQTSFKRVILKLSGESLADPSRKGINSKDLQSISQQIAEASGDGCQIAVVIGGGNILRGSQFIDSNGVVQRATAHYMGMLATLINSLALQDALESAGCPSTVMSALEVNSVAEPFVFRRAVRTLEKGHVLILAGGIGRPFVTTDTAAAQRAIELSADAVLKATRVEGVYSADPEKYSDAHLYKTLSYNEVIRMNLGIMDAVAIILCREHGIPILVFNFKERGNILRAITGQKIGTWVDKF